jgi:hypothetical protein
MTTEQKIIGPENLTSGGPKIGLTAPKPTLDRAGY